MFIAVRYSPTTQKVGEAIGKALETPAEPISKPLDKHVDALFLGATKASEVAQFIASNADKMVQGKIVVFGPGAKIHADVKAVAASSRVKPAEMPFTWPAPFLFLNKDRPNDADLADAAEFAKKQIKQLSMT